MLATTEKKMLKTNWVLLLQSPLILIESISFFYFKYTLL